MNILRRSGILRDTRSLNLRYIAMIQNQDTRKPGKTTQRIAAAGRPSRNNFKRSDFCWLLPDPFIATGEPVGDGSGYRQWRQQG
jgi:hypothetical protein